MELSRALLFDAAFVSPVSIVFNNDVGRAIGAEVEVDAIGSAEIDGDESVFNILGVVEADFSVPWS